jgi:hypothetical protein
MDTHRPICVGVSGGDGTGSGGVEELALFIVQLQHAAAGATVSTGSD